MVTLKNGIKKGNIFVTDYFPEDNENDIGHIEFDITNNKTTAIKYCKEDEESVLKPYSHKAILAIKEMAKNNNFKKNYTYMWY